MYVYWADIVDSELEVCAGNREVGIVVGEVVGAAQAVIHSHEIVVEGNHVHEHEHAAPQEKEVQPLPLKQASKEAGRLATLPAVAQEAAPLAAGKGNGKDEGKCVTGASLCSAVGPVVTTELGAGCGVGKGKDRDRCAKRSEPPSELAQASDATLKHFDTNGPDAVASRKAARDRHFEQLRHDYLAGRCVWQQWL